MVGRPGALIKRGSFQGSALLVLNDQLGRVFVQTEMDASRRQQNEAGTLVESAADSETRSFCFIMNVRQAGFEPWPQDCTNVSRSAKLVSMSSSTHSSNHQLTGSFSRLTFDIVPGTCEKEKTP